MAREGTAAVRARMNPTRTTARKPTPPRTSASPAGCMLPRRPSREFQRDQCTDLAAALTYYAVLSLFPALLAMVSLVGLFGQGPADHHDAAGDRASTRAEPVATSCEASVDQLVDAPTGAGSPWSWACCGALWSASGYVGAFGRAMNRIYEIGEGRPFWKLRPLMLVITWSPWCWWPWSPYRPRRHRPGGQAVGDAIGLGATGRDRLEHRQMAGACCGVVVSWSRSSTTPRPT